jgi:OFA family oxalate/formate antiporter-like MFS transporter
MFDYRREMKKRWLYLITGVILLLFLGLIYAWSVFRVPLAKEFGWTDAQLSVTFSVSMMMFCLGGLISGIINRKSRVRLTMILCALFLAAGFLGASNIHTLTGIYLTYGGLCGFGVGLGYNAVISTVVKWFPDKQGLISGITLMGFGFGGMLLGTAGAALISNLGWRMTFRMFGAVFAVIMIVGALVLKPAGEEFLHQLSGTGTRADHAVEEINAAQMIRRKNFWLYFLWAIILSAAGLSIINSSAVYAQQVLHIGLTAAAAIAGVVSVFNGIGRVIFGQIFDLKGYRVTMISVCAVTAAAAVMLMLSWKIGSSPVLILAFVIMGLAYGGVTPTNSAFAAHFFGKQNYALNFSIVNLNLIIASYLGPMIGSGSYMRTFTVILLFSAAALILTLLIRTSEQKSRK